MAGFSSLNFLGPSVVDTASSGTVLEAFFYGLYCLIFGQYLQIHIKKKAHERSILVYPIVLLFLLTTVYFILNLPQTFWLVLRPGTHQSFIWNVNIVSMAIYGFVDFISQTILIYRCWIMWNHMRWLVVLPLSMVLTFLSMILVMLPEMCRQSKFEDLSHLASWVIPLAISSICISLALNAIVTGLLVLRIVLVHMESRRSMSDAERRLHDLSPVISILVETGMVTFVCQLLFVIIFALQETSAIIIGSPMIMLYGITPTVIVVRAAMGTAYNVNHTSRAHSVMAFATNHNLPTETM